MRGNLVDGGPALFQSPPRPFDAQFLDIARGSDTCRSGEHASEIARAHRHPPRQGVDGEIGPQVIGHPGLQVGERCAIGHLRLQLRAELRLPAGALEEQHELPRHLPRHLRPVVILDQGKRQIHARSHSRRGVDPILTHEDGIDIDAHLRIALGQAQAAAPVGGGALAVEEAGLCKDECPGADGGEPADALGDAL